MVSRSRHFLEKLIKQWAQDHCADYSIADYNTTDEAMQKTQEHLTWVIREGHANIDLESLADRLEIFLENRHKRNHIDGMWCSLCGTFCQFADPNQNDDGFICYSCLHPSG